MVQTWSKSHPQVVQKLSKSCPRSVQQLSKSCPTIVQKSSKSSPKVVQKLVKSCSKVPPPFPPIAMLCGVWHRSEGVGALIYAPPNIAAGGRGRQRNLSCSAHPWVILESPLRLSWVTCEPSWFPLGVMLGSLLGHILGHPGVAFGVISGTLCGHHGAILGVTWGHHLAILGILSGYLTVTLGPFWDHSRGHSQGHFR